MAEPIIAGGIRAHVLIPSTSGLPRDVNVNIWHFNQTAGPTVPTDATFDEVIDRLIRLYTVPSTNPTVTNAFGGYWASIVPRTTDALEIKCYHLGDTPPREVRRQRKFTAPPLVGTSLLPPEVAVCGSFFAGQNVRRRRGRFYFGPLSAGANLGGEVTTPLRDGMVGALRRMRGENTATSLSQWCVLGMRDGLAANTQRGADTHVLREVTGGWVDNAFDTQRRRGISASSRIVL